jgi:enamine deaminase RidA (YjgF/YER057c/UK114 family)
LSRRLRDGRDARDGHDARDARDARDGRDESDGRGESDDHDDRSLVRHQVRSASPYEDVFGFSRAIRVGDRIHVAGTGPVWPDGACDPDPAVQTRRCFEIVADALADAGGTLADVVRTRMYLTDVEVSDVVGRVHGELFGDIRPVATMVVVAGLVDPRWYVEVEAEAQLS